MTPRMQVAEGKRRKRLTEAQIRDRADQLNEEYFRQMGWNRPEDIIIDLNEFYDFVLYPNFEYELSLEYDLGCVDKRKVLGKTINSEKKILIDRSIAPPNKNPKFIFSLGHEFGHCVLHPDWDILFRCTQEDIFGDNRDASMEIEANHFASHLIMPDNLVYTRFMICYNPRGIFRYIGPTKYWFDTYGARRVKYVYSYADFCRALAYPLTRYFSGISQQSLALKIHRLGLVDNQTGEPFGKEKIHGLTSLREVFNAT